MKALSPRAWFYIVGTLLAGTAIGGMGLATMSVARGGWLTATALIVLATAAQLIKARAPKHQSYHVTMVFLFAGVLLLDQALFVLLVLVPHVVEWVKERCVHSDRLARWYLQPFNISTHLCAGFAARLIHDLLGGAAGLKVDYPGLFAVSSAALLYVLINHVQIGLALVLARGVSWRQSGVMDSENLLSDLIMVMLGYIIAVLWQQSAALIFPALSPLILMYRALTIPQLKNEAHTDPKTGLWNARRFTTLFTSEVERARRFDRPLSLIMADLDFMRQINNTYGHLAGDAVLEGLGSIIRNHIRRFDIAARFGGEEFCIVVPEATLEEARVLAERLRAEVEEARFTATGVEVPITATMSLGVSNFPRDAATTTELIHIADRALYRAKHLGRNQVVTSAALDEVHDHDLLTMRHAG